MRSSVRGVTDQPQPQHQERRQQQQQQQAKNKGREKAAKRQQRVDALLSVTVIEASSKAKGKGQAKAQVKGGPSAVAPHVGVPSETAAAGALGSAGIAFGEEGGHKREAARKGATGAVESFDSSKIVADVNATGTYETDGVDLRGGKAEAAPGGKRPKKRRRGGQVLSRGEAMELLRQTVTRFRAAQVSSSSSFSSPSSHGSTRNEIASGDRSDAGTANGTPAEVEAATADPGERKKDAATIAAEEFAEVARRCLGSGLPEIALEVRLSSKL